MKTKKTFRLSDEAIAILASQSNATEYLEELILGAPQSTPTTNSSVPQTDKPLTEGRVLYLIQQEIAKIPTQTPPTPKLQEIPQGSVPTNLPTGVVTGAEFVPKPPDPEFGYPCCKGISPCKHWLWDEGETIWRNSLTGKERDA